MENNTIMKAQANLERRFRRLVDPLIMNGDDDDDDDPFEGDDGDDAV